MKASNVISDLFLGNNIYVPTYQRAYSWETEIDSEGNGNHVNIFLSDLTEYKKSRTKQPYYFGHFLFEDKENRKYAVIDGQQRLTTIVIFVSTIFSTLKSLRALTDDEQQIFEDMIVRGQKYWFRTVDYDNDFFKDYVLNKRKKDRVGIKTVSCKRIADAYDYFSQFLEAKDEEVLIDYLSIIRNATCTTHVVNNESEAIQMFIFQNNRGKKPSNLEIIKAQFMFNVHLYGGEETEGILEDIKNKFEEIYKSISMIEYRINEDDVLIYSLRVFFNNLDFGNPLERIDKILEKDGSIEFIKEFTFLLSSVFTYLTEFFNDDEKEYIDIHSIIMLGRIGVAIPFIIKCYQFGLSKSDLCELCRSLESLIIRHRIIGTRADVVSRLNQVYKGFSNTNPDVSVIINHINWMKDVDKNSWYWAHWNNLYFSNALNGDISHNVATFLLWKYECYLESGGKGGYRLTRYDKIEKPELEHIAPQTEPKIGGVEAGYCEYDEEFHNEYKNSLGNFLLLSKPHNGSASNRPFKDKRASYNYLAQQRIIQQLTKDDLVWNKSKIEERKNILKQFVLDTF